MIEFLRSLKIEKSERSNSITQHSQILGYKVLVALLLCDYFYKYFVLKEQSIDIILVFLLSAMVSIRYQALNKVFSSKWNDTIVTLSVICIVMFAIILIIFFYQYK
jgi:hypothetical protein